MSPLVKAALHALKVAATIAGSVLGYAVITYFSNPANVATFGTMFARYGVPVALLNVVIAAGVKYIKEHTKQQTLIAQNPDVSNSAVPPQP